MRDYSLTELTGNPLAEQMEIEGDGYDCRRPSDALPDSPDLEREMAEAFGWDADPTDEQMEADYAARQCDESDLLARYPDLQAMDSDALIALVDNPRPGDDRDEVNAVVAILITRRLNADGACVPA